VNAALVTGGDWNRLDFFHDWNQKHLGLVDYSGLMDFNGF